MSRKKYEVLVGTRGVVYTGGGPKRALPLTCRKRAPPPPTEQMLDFSCLTSVHSVVKGPGPKQTRFPEICYSNFIIILYLQPDGVNLSNLDNLI